MERQEQIDLEEAALRHGMHPTPSTLAALERAARRLFRAMTGEQGEPTRPPKPRLSSEIEAQ